MDIIEVLGRNFQTHTPLVDVVFRILVAGVLGAVIGLTREWRAKPAGLKTHMMVTLAAATFSILALEMFQDAVTVSTETRADPIRVIEAMAKATAFLGAGAIIQRRDMIQGLTTGASIWLCGSIGVAAGTAHFGLAVLATFMGLIILTVVRYIETTTVRRRRNRKTEEDGE